MTIVSCKQSLKSKIRKYSLVKLNGIDNFQILFLQNENYQNNLIADQDLPQSVYIHIQ